MPPDDGHILDDTLDPPFVLPFNKRFRLCSLCTVYVVFGAAGAVGSDLVGRLVAQSGAQVFASDRDTSDLDKIKEATIVPADTLDQDAVGIGLLVPFL